MVALPFLVMAAALLLGIPVAICLGGAGILGLWLVTGNLNVVIGTDYSNEPEPLGCDDRDCGGVFLDQYVHG